MCQPVEKVVVGPIGTLKQLQYTSKPVQNTTKPGFKALEQGSENNTREFFNTLVCSRKYVYEILHRLVPSDREGALFRLLDLRGNHYIVQDYIKMRGLR